MALTKDKLDEYLTRTSVDTGSLFAWYGFNEWSGHVVFNEKYSNTKSASIVYVGTTGCVNNLTAPSYLIGSGEDSFSFAAGSGYFDSNSIFKLGKEFTTGSEGFTIIANLGNFDNTQNLDKGKTLFTTMENANDTSGFAVGINGLNRLYFHYAGFDGEIDRGISVKNELNNYCVFSIGCKPYYSYTETIPTYSSDSKVGEREERVTNLSHFDYAYHDVTNINPNTKTDWSAVSCDGCVDYKPSDTFYIGDFYTPSEGYVGYKGHILDVLIFDGVLTLEQRHELSKAFFVENIIPAGFAQRDLQENVITGSGIVSIQVTGTGITGYENVEIVTSMPTRDGGSIEETVTVIKSGVEGPLSGEVVSFGTSTGVVTRTIVEFVPEIIEYGAGDYAPYSKNTLTFYDPLDSNDIYELYSYSGRSDRINRQISIDMISSHGDWKQTPIVSCENYANALCTAQSWSGKVCYPCNRYTGESDCGDCYKITGTVDGPCGEDDTCESGLSSIEDCKGFIFDECLKRTDSSIGGFTLKRTLAPSQGVFNPYANGYVDDLDYITSGGSLFINGLFSKPGQETCKMQYHFESYGTKKGNLAEVCSLHSGKYIVKDGYVGYYSGLHSFNIRYRYDYYDNTGHRFYVDDYKYVEPKSEFGIYDDGLDDGLDGPTGEDIFLKYIVGSSNLTFSGLDYIKKDIYLNGQKLVSGLNYVGDEENKIDLIRGTLPEIEDAQLSFITVPIYANRLTGTNAGGYKKFGFDLLSEKIWINGIRQAAGINYIKISDQSLLAGTVLMSRPAIIYGDYQNFFNDKIQTGFKV